MSKETLKIMNILMSIKKELSNFFIPKNELINHKNSIVEQLNNNNSISIHIRRNRFSDQIGLTDTKKQRKIRSFYQPNY